ncbi:MAG: hypothetical protein HKP62_03190 [Sulfurovum sp.]|nr:hypothetical protein [Sulfurovum sp.]MBT8348438.1 hypothetical protein [Sulfurovum sp.]NNJ45002.1 hypothetical protein [Sulfurovum sp.]
MKKRDDLDFNEFEKMLKEKLVHIEDNIKQLRTELDSVGSDDGKDLASLHSLSDQDNTILHQQEHELKETIHALGKINNGTFGICETSSRPIPVERLRVNPIARTKVGLED